MVNESSTSKTLVWLPHMMAVISVLAVLALCIIARGQIKKTALLHGQLVQTTYDLKLLDSILSDTKAHAATIFEVRHSLPRGYTEVSDALVALEQAARARSVTLDNRLEDTLKSEADGVHSLMVSMHVSGSYTNIRGLLSDISRLPYHSRIMAISLDTNGGTLSGLVSLKLFIE